ncbi:MAG: methionyl-tRNA formyltransferase [Alteromonadaceae bacterium]|nr:methionyl-tRNA formyltransferase [Alteromonadaceae bacterium]|tara:strand:+ start:1606 stop:2292 length:687 start_codon:yes stop_codon:yes gene_type:complete
MQKISVIVDPPGGWFDPHAQRLVHGLRDAGFDAHKINRQEDVGNGDIGFYLSCMRITPPEVLARNSINIVVHASDLPQGRGFSPQVWQVLEGKSDIPLTMIEMVPEVDAGNILMQHTLSFEGHELNTEMREAMGDGIIKMCLEYACANPRPVGREQSGPSSWYRRRGPEHSQLDPDKTIAEQFDLLRVVDNDRYPAFFDLRGHRYTLKIDKIGPTEDIQVCEKGGTHG